MTEAQAAEWISEHMTALYGYAFARLYNKRDVDDLVSEIICALLSSARRLRDDGAFHGFVWRTAENTFRKYIRRAARDGETWADDGGPNGVYAPSAEDAYMEGEEKDRMLFLLRRELALLSKTHREICLAYYADRKSCSRIAEEQGISVEMVKYHLFKTRRLLKEGIGMNRELGEKSYNPGVFRLDFWGDCNCYGGLFQRKLPGSIMLAAYYAPMTAEELSVELGVSMPYLEEELAILANAGLLRCIGGKYQTNLVILTDEYEKEFVQNTADVYSAAKDGLYEAVKKLLPRVRTLDFRGRDYDDNRLLFALLNIALVNGYALANEKSPLGGPNRLALGGNGWVFGYDNDYANHHYNGVTLEARNREGDAYFSSENYRAIAACQQPCSCFDFASMTEVLCDAIWERAADDGGETLLRLLANGLLCREGGRIAANFPVFRAAVFDELCALLAPAAEQAAACMLAVSDAAERVLKEHVPAALKAQCGDIAKIHHRLDAAAFLMEAWIADGKLTLPSEKTPLCVWGVRMQPV